MKLRSFPLTVGLLQLFAACGGDPSGGNAPQRADQTASATDPQPTGEPGVADPNPWPSSVDEQATSADGQATAVAPVELERMREFVTQRVSPADIRSTYTEDDGTVVDCVSIEAQPALRNPLSRGHKIQAPPRLNAPGAGYSGIGERATLEAGEGCKAGSVPIERVTLSDVARFPSLDAFLHQDKRPHSDDQSGKNYSALSEVHEYAHAYRTGQYTGMMGNFQIFDPFTDRPADNTISQLWAYAANASGGMETVEVGINSSWTIYRDYDLHWFIFNFNYGGAGCYNNKCGDFVQTSSTKRPGAQFSKVSQDGGAQYTMGFGVERDSIGNWWIHANGEWVGYYIASFFSSPGLRDYATRADFGGEVGTLDNSPHTSTDMGTGHWPSEGWTHASFVANILTRNQGSTSYASPILDKISRTRSECYNLAMGPAGTSWGTYFYFGGSGYNANCH